MTGFHPKTGTNGPTRGDGDFALTLRYAGVYFSSYSVRLLSITDGIRSCKILRLRSLLADVLGRWG